MLTNRAMPLTDRTVTRAMASTPASAADMSATVGNGRGRAAMLLAERIGRLASVQREDVTPEMEPESPSITTEESDEDFDENEDVTPELEPFDPTIESALRATVEGDETEVTITAEPGEVLDVTETEDGGVIVSVEDE